MQKLKIALFHNIIPDSGSKRAYYELVKRLSRRHDLDLYKLRSLEESFYNLSSFVRNTYIFEQRWLYFKMRPFSYLNIFISFFNLYKLIKVFSRIAQAINNNNYDVVFVGQCLISFFAPSVLKYLKAPTVYLAQEHSRRFYESPVSFARKIPFRKFFSNLLFNPFYKFFDYVLKINDRRNIRCAGLVISNSNYSKECIYKAYGVLSEVVYLGVDIDKFKFLDLPKENLVLSIGHLHPRKGHEFVIQAVARIPNVCKPKLAIVYPFVPDMIQIEYKNYLQHLADESDVEIIFFEQITDTELVTVYNKAKITACAHIKEPFGLVPLESMACQTPVVAIREGGLKESVVHDLTGILCERDIAEFSQAIEYLLKNDELRAQMSIAGRQHVLKHWTWDRTAAELEKTFFKVIHDG